MDCILRRAVQCGEGTAGAAAKYRRTYGCVAVGWLIACFASVAWAQDVQFSGRIIDTSTKAGISGATVKLVWRGASKQEDVTLHTDAEGAFRADLPLRGEVSIVPNAPDYLAAVPFQYLRVGSSKAISLDIEMVRYSALAGRVVDEDTGKPLEGIQVDGRRAMWTRGARELVPGSKGVKTAADGTFLITELNAYDYVLQVNGTLYDSAKQGQAPRKGYSRVFWPGPGDEESASPLPLPPGATLNVGDIRLRHRDPIKVSIKVSGDCAEGQKYEVELAEYKAHSAVGVARTVLACGGTAVLPQVSPGAYILQAEATWGPEGMRQMGAVTLRVFDRDLELTVPVTPPLAIHGRVSVAKGRDLPENMRAKLWPRGSDVAATISPVHSADVVKVAPDGTFSSYAYVPPGGNIVADVLGMPAGFYVSEVRYNGIAAAGNVFIVNSHAAQQEIEVICSDKAASVSGVVRTADNQPVGRAALLLAQWPPQLQANYPVAVRERMADGSGNFLFTGLPPGAYRAVAVQESEREMLEQPGRLTNLLSAAETIDLTQQSMAISNLTVASARE